MLTLHPESPSAGHRPHPFGQGQRLTIGRRPENDLTLPVSHVSSRHAVIHHRGGGQYVLADLNSTNGSAVQRGEQRLVLGPRGQAEVRLQSGDLLLLGDIDDPVRLRVEIRRPAAGAEEPLQETVVATRARGTSGALRERLSADRGALSALYRMVEAINALGERDAILAAVARATLDALPHAVDVLLVLRQPKGRLSVAAEAHREGGVAHTPDEKVCAQVAEEGGRALLFGRHQASTVPAHTLVSRGVGSGIAAPIGPCGRAGEGGISGVLQVNCRPGRFELGERELDLCLLLAHHAAQALERAELLAQLRRAEQRLRAENSLLRRHTQPRVTLVAESPAMARVVDEVRRAAATDVTVLLSGETGTGKEVTARYLHEQSARAGALLVPVNCGALAESLLDSELFGHRKGAFTGAGGDRKGVFEVAAGGTVFLDEIGETPPAVQVRLLRVLEEGKIKVLGEAVERPVDVRIVAATNRDLAAMVERGEFRRDLYYRLRVFPLRLPPLRERPEDIEPLCRLFLRRFSEQLGKRVGPPEPEFLELLRRYPFPGNVRELANELERAVVRAEEGAPLGADLLSEELHGAPPEVAPGAGPEPLRDQVARFEQEVIRAALARNGGKKIPTARELGLTRQGLTKKMDRLGM